MLLQMDLKGNFLQCRRFHTACHPKAASLRQLDAATEEYFVSWTRTLTHPNTAQSDLTSILDASLMRRIHICIFIKLELRDLIFCRLSILGSSIYKRLKTPHYNKISSTSICTSLSEMRTGHSYINTCTKTNKICLWINSIITTIRV